MATGRFALFPVLRAVALAMLVASAALPVAPAQAASMHPFQNRTDNGDGGAGPFNVDPDPCRPGNRRHGVEGQGANCPDDFASGQARGNYPRHPGPSAFGLQFNSGE